MVCRHRFMFLTVKQKYFTIHASMNIVFRNAVSLPHFFKYILEPINSIHFQIEQLGDFSHRRFAVIRHWMMLKDFLS